MVLIPGNHDNAMLELGARNVEFEYFAAAVGMNILIVNNNHLQN